MDNSDPKVSEWTALWARTAADEDPVEYPALAPHLRSVTLDDERLLLCSDDRKFTLHGPLYVRLVPLLNGASTRAELIEQCVSSFKGDEIVVALKRLAERGFIVAHTSEMDAGAAAFWTAQGVSPSAAMQMLAEQPVFIRSLNDGPVNDFEAAFERIGGAVTSDQESARVHWLLVDSYFDSRLPAINQACVDVGRTWGLMRPAGLRPLVGPLFLPGEGCWRCLEACLRGNLEVDAFLSTLLTQRHEFQRSNGDALGKAIWEVAALQLARVLVIPADGINENLIALNVLTGEHTLHRFRPQEHCPGCGYRRPSAEAVDNIEESDKPALVFTSGGYRRLDSMETVFRHRHLIDPLTGVVGRMLRLSAEEDDWNHTFLASHGFTSGQPDFDELTHSLHSKSSGKGTTRAQAMASAFGEAIERYSGIYRGHNGLVVRRRFIDFERGEAIHPNSVMLFSERQYALRAGSNPHYANGKFSVPSPFSADAEIEWVPVRSMRDRVTRYVPAELVYYYQSRNSESACLADSNGAAAGNTLDEAIVQGFLELIERDAYAIWWYNRLKRPAVPLEAFGDLWLEQANTYYSGRHRDVWLLDITADTGVSAYVAVSRRTDKAVQDIILGAGAHFDPRIAALRAVTELNQHLLAVEHADADGGGYADTDPAHLDWWHKVTTAECPWLQPQGERPPPAGPGADACTVTHCVATVQKLGLDLLVLDQTHADIGLRVAKVLAPGLRHFWPRFAPGRLYDVPVRLGWLSRPLSENELSGGVDVFV